MSLENKQAISKVRFEKAEECLADAKLLLERESYKSAANRSYYAVFHAMRAVLAYDGYDSKKHSGIIAEFRRLYIKTGIFESSMSDTIRSLFDLRTDIIFCSVYFPHNGLRRGIFPAQIIRLTVR